MRQEPDLRLVLLRGALVTLLYTAGAWLGTGFASVSSAASAVWPATGVSIWAVFCFGPWMIPFVWLGGFLASLASGSPILSSLGVALGNALQPVVAVALLHRLDFRPAMERTRDVLTLWLGGIAAAAISAAVGVASLLLADRIPSPVAPHALGIWWLGDSMGALVVAPLLFTVPAALRRGRFRGRGWEIAALLGALLLVEALIFGQTANGASRFYARAFPLFPVAVWAALRFGVPGAAASTALISALAVLATGAGRGPFALHGIDGVVLLQLFLAVIVLTALLLAAATSERHAAEQQLVTSERLAAVGTLAAGVAHEINNPLTFVLTNLELLERELPAGNERGRRMLEDARFGAERMNVIVRDLRIFSRDNSTDEQVRLDEVVESALRLAGREVTSRGELRTELGDPPPVCGSQARLGQVVLNLLLNAAQALPAEGGVVRVATGTARDGRAFVEVEDTGPGIAPGDLGRLFTPFFTTKPVGSGMGLGLAISRKIVEDHRGEISVRSQPGRGASFRVLLPALPRAAAPPPPVAVQVEAPAQEAQRKGRVLVVDDEARLADSFRLLLEPEHEVAIRTSGAEALDLLRRDTAFDVIFCDLHMPGLSGIDLFAQLRAEDPAIASRFVFLSGGAYTDEARRFVAEVENPVLEKPVRPGRLLSIVEARLSA